MIILISIALVAAVIGLVAAISAIKIAHKIKTGNLYEIIDQ